MRAIDFYKQKGNKLKMISDIARKHCSCVTPNPYYTNQAFAANNLPIRLKLKTRLY